ncbi:MULTISPECIES: hypothetical protein [Pseudomonas]|uniref:hypothetical protein n=1 Tax=Pseudomonas TaxID=286 RepID=UPI001AE95CCB|nr:MULTISPECIES: hypothetical protein [unclassified Pseudomonas]MBP1124403.1 uncharacterized protein YjbI with pentapeptide repeats [Pseudomonas sp. PvP025]MDQ0398263.1 uncharacterized protein YjbI with pentapeptide repeats [Pseudomonas sp. PvP006]
MNHLHSGHILATKKTESFSQYPAFKQALLTFIEDSFKLHRGTITLDKKGRMKGALAIFKKFNASELHVHNIRFPGGIDGARLFDIFECFGRLQFTQCSFGVRNILLKSPKVSFFDCQFSAKYEVLDMHLRKDKAYGDCLYQKCRFLDEVRCGSHEKKERLVISHPLFANCNFKGRVTLENAELRGYFLDGDSQDLSVLSNLRAKNCIFHSGFYVNRQKTQHMLLRSCVFKGKFELKENSIRKVVIVNCNFEKVSDFYKTSVVDFTLRKSVFDTFAGFEECQFGSPKSVELSAGRNPTAAASANFTYVTFMQFASFRGATFHTGLDLEKINTIEQPNFHRAKVSYDGTPRETFRIIKHALDSHGAHIEANYFFALEMKRRQKELSEGRGSRLDKWVYLSNQWASNFGQSYVRPLIWIAALALLFH